MGILRYILQGAGWEVGRQAAREGIDALRDQADEDVVEDRDARAERRETRADRRERKRQAAEIERQLRALKKQNRR
jgi:hypothetical protein